MKIVDIDGFTFNVDEVVMVGQSPDHTLKRRIWMRNTWLDTTKTKDQILAILGTPWYKVETN